MNFASLKVLMMNLMALTLISIALPSIHAHEGHKEASLKSYHGGLVKKTTNTFVEIVQLEGDILVYLRDHNDKAVNSKKVVLTGDFKDSKKKIQPLTLKDEGGKFFKVLNNTKGESFFSVILKINGEINGVKANNEQVTFNLENSNE